jgi:hypothetical protein
MMPPGRPVPPALGGEPSEQVERAFLEAFFLLGRRISLFLSLPFSTLHRFSLKKEIDNIGRPMNFGSTVVTGSNRPDSVYPKLPIFPTPVTIYNAGTTPRSTGPWF